MNGYNQYSSYTNRIKKISPPNQIPVSPPRTLDSVGLVLSQDSYQRSVNEFEQIMRDLSNGSFDMGRPQRNADVIDATANSTKKSHLISNGDNFYPKTHSRQLISDGEKQSVEIVTKFHSDEDHSPTYRFAINRYYFDCIIHKYKKTSSAKEVNIKEEHIHWTDNKGRDIQKQIFASTIYFLGSIDKI